MAIFPLCPSPRSSPLPVPDLCAGKSHRAMNEHEFFDELGQLRLSQPQMAQMALAAIYALGHTLYRSCW